MDITKNFYFWGTTLLLPLWFLLFKSKGRRRDMLLLGVFMGFVVVITEFFYARFDYWHPTYIIPALPLEDFYYGFIFGGISTEIYEAIFQKRNSAKRKYPVQMKFILIYLAVTIVSLLVLIDLLNVNSTWAFIISLLLIGAAEILLRKDLFIPAVMNGLLTAMLTILMFSILIVFYPDIFKANWLLGNLSGFSILSIPFEEIFFAFAVGLVAGNAYELIYGYGIVDEKKKT